MKKFFMLLLVAMIYFTVAGCVKTAIKIDNEKNEDSMDTQNTDTENYASYSPLYFNSEEDLIEAISEVKMRSGDQVLTIDSKFIGEQTYNRYEDLFDMALIDKLYSPAAVLENTSLIYIRVTMDYVAYCYGDENGKETANFVWLRNMTPEVAMNDLEGRGATVRNVTFEGIDFTILEWPDSETGNIAAYSIHWVQNGIAYQANIKYGPSDAEMIGFCITKGVDINNYGSETAWTNIGAEASAGSEDAGTDAFLPQAHLMPTDYCYTSEEELSMAVGSAKKGEPVYGLERYFVPETVPEGYRFKSVTVREAYAAAMYLPEDGGDEYYLIEWYRTLTADDLEPQINRMFIEPAKHVEKLGEYYVLRGDKAVDVLWAQNGLCFHAVLPFGANEGQIESFCNAVEVPIRMP